MGNFRNFILDFIFPRRCLGCNILLYKEASSYVCRRCLKTITFKNDFACAFCKSPVKNGKTCPYCIKDHFLDRLLVATSYENMLAEKMLKTMKYRFVLSLADDIASLMIGYIRKHLVNNQVFDGNTMIVIPVPLHFKRLNWRGFNQAEIIAEKIADFFGWPVITNALRRLHNRKPQADMPDRYSRIKNAQNVFKLNPIYRHRKSIDNTLTGKTVLLVDDISTTGSTLNDCARVLKDAGTKEVIGFVFARGTTETQKKRKTQKNN